MTYQQFKALAMKHYNEGGDVIVECWSESDFNEYVSECGEITRSTAFEIMGLYDAVETETEALAKSYRDEAVTEEEEEEEESNIYDYWEYEENEWRPGDSPWNAPGMSVSDFVR